MAGDTHTFIFSTGYFILLHHFFASSVSLVYFFSSFSHVSASFLRLDFWVLQDFPICKQTCFIIHGGHQSVIMVFSYNHSNVGKQGRG